MVWVRLEDSFDEHPKIVGLSDGAFRAHVEALCYSNRHLLDGRISVGVARVRGWTRRTRELAGAGLWEEVEGGWQIHDYSEYQPTRGRIEDDRADRSERARRAAHARWDARGNAHRMPDACAGDAGRMPDACPDDANTYAQKCPVPDPDPVAATSADALAAAAAHARVPTAAEAGRERDPGVYGRICDAWMEATGMTLPPLSAERFEAAAARTSERWVMDAIAETGACGKRAPRYALAIVERWETEGRSAPGGSNDGAKRGRDGNGRAAAPERCPCGRTRWADAGGDAGYCEHCGTQEPISTEMLARIGRLEG